LIVLAGLSREQRGLYRKTKIGMTYIVRTGRGHQDALVGRTSRPTWTYSNGDLSICVYRATTCGHGRGILWRPPAYSLLVLLLFWYQLIHWPQYEINL